MVEAIEDLFIPVLVYNNKPEDEKTLKSFSEPAWNNPVVRFLNSGGQDLIERKDGVWQTPALAQRLVASLEAANRSVPEYVRLVAADANLAPDAASKSGKATFAMHCYWEGEAKLGRLSGVLSTRAAWVDGKEVVDITYDPSILDYHQLVDQAKSIECASTVYARTTEQFDIAKKLVGNHSQLVPADFIPRSAADSEQKYYLRNSIYALLDLSGLQAVKINSLLADNKVAASDIEALLSSRQRENLERKK